MSIKKLKPAVDFDFSIVAISCAIKDYRLCWELNSKLNLSLRRAEKDIEIFRPGKKRLVYPLYEFPVPENRIHFHLISNKNESGYLVPSHKKVDFFLRIKGGENLIQKKKMLREIKSIPAVETAFGISPRKIKSVEILMLA